jgi:ABC-type nitrate/sulfonate/bicarbonate transport system substrate-binding protein
MLGRDSQDPETETVSNQYSAVIAALFAAIALATLPSHADIKGDGSKVRLLYNPSGTNSFPPFVIKKFGLDSKHGFELVGVPQATTASGITAIQAGGAELGTFGWNDIQRMKNAGIKVVGVAPFLRWGADFTLAPVNSPVHTFGDLKGRKYGVTARTALNTVVVRVLAQKIYNIDLEKDATIVEGAPSLLRGLAEQGQLDAFEMFNSLTPAMIATGKFRVLAKVSDLVRQLGLPDAPFLLYTVEGSYAAAHPTNVRAFLAAYHDAIDILNTDDGVWLERGKEMKMSEESTALFRKEARTDIWTKFAPDTEANIRTTFAELLEVAGPTILGIGELSPGFMTLDYQ